MLTDRNDLAIVSAIVAMAKSLGLKTLAEGVEEAAQAEHLLALGCDEAQGYYFARPEPAEVFARRWLQSACPLCVRIVVVSIDPETRGRQRKNEVARYGQSFKDRAVARLLPPESVAVQTLARELSISAATLARWRAEALSQPVGERGWSAGARFEAVLSTAAMDEASKGAWCREHGVYPQTLEQWRTAALQALDEPEEVARQALREKKAERGRIKELERDLRRKEKALAEAAALLVLSKKLEAIFPKDEDA